MADNEQEKEQQQDQQSENQPKDEAQSQSGGKSLLSRLQLLALLIAVILGECVAAIIFIPRASATAPESEQQASVKSAQSAQSEQAAEQGQTTPIEEDVLPPELTEDIDAADLVEVDLGEYSVTSYQPSRNTTLRIDFHLFGTVKKEDQEEFQKLFGESTNRIREQVITTVRAAEMAELTDAGLGLIKRRILAKTNRLLGKPLLKTIVVSDFSFIEQ